MNGAAQASSFSINAFDNCVQLTAAPSRVAAPPANQWETACGTCTLSVQDVCLASAPVVVDVLAPGPVAQGAPLPASSVDSEVTRAVEAVTHMVETIMQNMKGLEAGASSADSRSTEDTEEAHSSALALQLASVAVANLQAREAGVTESTVPVRERVTAALASTEEPQERTGGKRRQRAGRRGLFAWLFQRGKELLLQFGQLRIDYHGDNPFTKGMLRVAEGALALAIVLVGLI